MITGTGPMIKAPNIAD